MDENEDREQKRPKTYREIGGRMPVTLEKRDYKPSARL